MVHYALVTFQINFIANLMCVMTVLFKCEKGKIRKYSHTLEEN